MGAAIGLMLGLGLLSLVSAVVSPAVPPSEPSADRHGWPGGDTLLAMLVGAVGAAVPVGWLTSDPVAALLAGALAGGAVPVARQEAERRRRTTLLRAWPEVVEGLLGARQTGLDLREAWLAEVRHAPPALRTEISLLAREIDAAGDPVSPIRSLQRRLADPTTERVARALLLGSESGQTGRLLRLLAADLRADAATEAKRSTVRVWSRVVIGLAAVSPWVAGYLLAGGHVTWAGPTVLAGLAGTAAVALLSDHVLAGQLDVRTGR